MANATTNFLPVHQDEWKMKKLPFKASAAMAEGAAVGYDIVSNDVTGYLDLMGTENAAGYDFAGILAEPIAATDSDYATAGKLKAVWVPKTREAEAFFSVGAGTFTAADVGKTVEIHSDSVSLAVDTAGKGARITGYKSSTQGKCKFSLPNTETA